MGGFFSTLERLGSAVGEAAKRNRSDRTATPDGNDIEGLGSVQGFFQRLHEVVEERNLQGDVEQVTKAAQALGDKVGL